MLICKVNPKWYIKSWPNGGNERTSTIFLSLSMQQTYVDIFY